MSKIKSEWPKIMHYSTGLDFKEDSYTVFTDTGQRIQVSEIPANATIGYRMANVSRELGSIMKDGLRKIKVRRFNKSRWVKTTKWVPWRINLRVTI